VSAGRLIGVGVGPGDPGHLTINALRALQEADRVFVPATESSRGAHGRAEAVVALHVPEDRIERLFFSMRSGSARPAQWDDAGKRIAAVTGGGGTAAFATLGDPNVYSTFTYVAATVRNLAPNVEVSTIPGITAMQDLAARSGTVLAEGSESVTLVAYTVGASDLLRDVLLRDGTVVVYKGGPHLPELLDAIREAGRLGATIYGEDLGLDGEQIDAASTRGGNAPYMSTVIVPARRTGRRGAKL